MVQRLVFVTRKAVLGSQESLFSNRTDQLFFRIPYVEGESVTITNSANNNTYVFDGIVNNYSIINLSLITVTANTAIRYIKGYFTKIVCTGGQFLIIESDVNITYAVRYRQCRSVLLFNTTLAYVDFVKGGGVPISAAGTGDIKINKVKILLQQENNTLFLHKDIRVI